jgi:hypothetical protein
VNSRSCRREGCLPPRQHGARGRSVGDPASRLYHKSRRLVRSCSRSSRGRAFPLAQKCLAGRVPELHLVLAQPIAPSGVISLQPRRVKARCRWRGTSPASNRRGHRTFHPLDVAGERAISAPWLKPGISGCAKAGHRTDDPDQSSRSPRMTHGTKMVQYRSCRDRHRGSGRRHPTARLVNTADFILPLRNEIFS